MGGYSSHPHLRCDHCGSIIPETGDEVRFSVAVGSDERPPIVSVIWRRGWYDVTTVRSADQHIPRRVERAIDRAIRRRARRGRRWLSPLTIRPAGIDEALDAAFGDDATVRVEGRRR